MNNNIWGKNIYSNLINSYMKTPSNSNIKGTLLAINENKDKIRIGISSDKALDITLKEPIQGQIGNKLVIEKQNIQNSKIVDLNFDNIQQIQNSLNKYDYILESLDILKNDDSVQAVKTLDNHGVDITKENVLSFMYAKKQLNNISKDLDYDTALKLKEKNIDLEKESIQKILHEMESVQGGKRPFSLLRFLGIKKDMSTEEAEKIAYNIYGNKMGKDITDIIKALDKAGLEPTKERIEEVNNIFSKLHNIETIEDKTIIDTLKNKIEASIDNLYKLKNAIVRGAVEAENRLGNLASKAYGAYSGAVSNLTERDLRKLDGDIKARLEDMGIKATEDIVNLSKDVISKGLDLTKENLERIMTIKGAIVELSSSLDYEKTALLMASGVSVDKVDVSELINTMGISEEAYQEGITIGLNRLELLELIESIDIKTLALHIKLGLPNTLESLKNSQTLLNGQITIEEWISNLNKLHGSDDILSAINKSDLEAMVDRIANKESGELDMAAQTFLRTNSDKLGAIMDEGYRVDMAKALLQNEIPLSSGNMQEIYMLKKGLERALDNLTPDLIQMAVNEGTTVEKLSLNKLMDMANSLDINNLNKNIEPEDILRNAENTANVVDKMKDMVDALKQITPERRDTIISLLMKNAMPLTLKEVQNLSFFLNNERQVGQQLDEILSLIEKNNNEEITNLAEKLKTSLMKINTDIKEGKQIGERPYEEFAKILRELESKSTFLSNEDRSALQKSGEKLLDSLELQLHLNREDTLLQLPLMMGDQFKNLQMYVMRDKKGSKKIDPNNMSVLLNFDTNNMGNINIYVAVNYKNIVMKMGLESQEDENLVDSYSKELKVYLEDLGYDLKELSFRVDNDNHILSMTDDIEGNHRTMKKLLDVRI